MRRTRFRANVSRTFLVLHHQGSRSSHNYKLLSNLIDIYKNIYTVFDSAQILDSSKKLLHISFSYKIQL